MPFLPKMPPHKTTPPRIMQTPTNQRPLRKVKCMFSSSTLIGPFEPKSRTRWRAVGHKHIRKAEEANFKPNFSFFTSLRRPKHAHVERNLLGFVELLVLLRFGTFPFEERAICGVTSGQRSMEWSAFPFSSQRITSLNGVRRASNSAQEASTRHICGRKTGLCKMLTGWRRMADGGFRMADDGWRMEKCGW